MREEKKKHERQRGGYFKCEKYYFIYLEIPMKNTYCQIISKSNFFIVYCPSTELNQ